MINSQKETTGVNSKMISNDLTNTCTNTNVGTRRAKTDLHLNWMDQLRQLSMSDKTHAQYWFWDHFNWTQHSLWIGKLNRLNRLPVSNEDVIIFIRKLIRDITDCPQLQSSIYVKFYFSRNIKTGDPDINYLLICNTPTLPIEFKTTLIEIIFEKYQLTESFIKKDPTFNRAHQSLLQLE